MAAVLTLEDCTASSAKAVRGETRSSIGAIRRLLSHTSKAHKIGIDDLAGRIISAVQTQPKSAEHSTELMDEILGLHVWYRLHRGLMWTKLNDSDRYSPVVSQFLRLEGTIKRVSNAGLVSSIAASYMLGMIRAGLLDLEGAALRFSVGSYHESLFMARFYGGASTFRAPSESLAGVGETAAPLADLMTVEREFLTARRINNGAVMVFSCEEKYFLGLASGMVQSLIDSGGACEVQIVVVAELEAVTERAMELIELLETGGLAGSVIVISSDYDTRTMSAVARYLWAEQVVVQEERACAVFDIDVAFTPDALNALANLESDTAVGLAYAAYGRSVAPWSSFLAGGSIVGFEPAGLFFLDRFRWYIGKNMVHGRRQWFIDQNAIFAANHLTAQFFPTARRANTSGLLRSIVTNLDTPNVMKVKRSTVG